MLYSPSIALAIWALLVATFPDATVVAILGALLVIAAIAVHVVALKGHHRD